MIRLAERMQQLRKEKKMTQKDMAEFLGIQTRTYQYYEGGGRQPDLETIVVLADLFGVTVDYIVGHSDERENPVKKKKYSFQERLKFLRTAQRISQKEMGEYLGISTRAYQYYESGERYPDFEGLLALADYFQVSIDYLVGRSDEP